MKIALVTWRDITYRHGWHSSSQLDNFITDDVENEVTQVGFLYEEDEDQIILLDSYFTNKESFGAPIKIPRGCIKEIKYLDSFTA